MMIARFRLSGDDFINSYVQSTKAPAFGGTIATIWILEVLKPELDHAGFSGSGGALAYSVNQYKSLVSIGMHADN